MEQTKKTTSVAKKMGWAGIALCGLCCALPIIGAVIGMASLVTLSFYLEKIGILALGLAAFLFLYAWYCKRENSKSCTTSCDTHCDCKPETVTQANKA